MFPLLQAGLRAVFPDQCVLCGALTSGGNGLCPECWRATPFLLARGCGLCGAPLTGSDGGPEEHCEDCRAEGRPWQEGTSTMLYSGTARRLAMSIKHGDRLDLMPNLAAWMAPRVRGLSQPATLLVPVPLHWRKLLRRKHNQAAGLARPLAAALELPVLPDALQRTRATPPQKDISRAERHAQQSGAIRAAPLWAARLHGQSVLLVDDVMTTGATLSACTRACQDAGAARVSVVTLARVCRPT